MAAVMVGGMVPPIAIALATLILKNKSTEDERKAGPTNFIMGLSFITEGAIPFAASSSMKTAQTTNGPITGPLPASSTPHIMNGYLIT